MQTNPESAAVEAVAWLVTNGGESCEPWLVYERNEVEALPASCIADPLYPQSALDALRGECVRIERENREGWKQAAHHRQRSDAAERRVAELEAGLASARRAIGDHFAPNDCYATGPLTGDEFLDLVQCPACAFLDQYAALTKVTP